MAGDIILNNGTTITAAELAEIAGEVKKLIAKESKEPSQYEQVQSLANLTTLPALLQNGLEFKLVRVAVELLNPVLQKTDLAIQWKRGDTGQFVDLITIAEIQAPAKAATDAANAAATKANTAATNADTATGKANTATTNANAATTAANNAAASANAAATAANNAADRVDDSITDISAEKTAAVNAANSANQAASNANQAASYATEIADHQPIIGEDGYWYRWDSANDVYVKTDDYTRGGTLYPIPAIKNNRLIVSDNDSNLSERIELKNNKLILKLG